MIRWYIYIQEVYTRTETLLPTYLSSFCLVCFGKLEMWLVSCEVFLYPAWISDMRAQIGQGQKREVILGWRELLFLGLPALRAIVIVGKW